MAQQGFYPDPPSRRMAWDADGTICIISQPSISRYEEISTVNKQIMNNEGNDSYAFTESGSPGQGEIFINFIFPEKRNITHYYAAIQKGYHYATIFGSTVAWSNDTTNAIDGNWTVVASSWQTNTNNGNGASFPATTPGFPDMRTRLETLPVDGVKAIRFQYGHSHQWLSDSRIYSFHLYGHKTAGETPHRIDFAYADGSELVQDFDYGDQPRGSTRIWSPVDGYNVGSGLYLRNRSPDKVATDVIVSLQNLSSDMINRLTLSKDDISYGNQVTYTDIQPLQIVGPVYVKHAVPDTTALSLYTARLKLAVGAWV